MAMYNNKRSLLVNKTLKVEKIQKIRYCVRNCPEEDIFKVGDKKEILSQG
jgi:hypothetical protein